MAVNASVMPQALEHVRRMRGGAQAHMMRCSDAGYYIVKFQNNPQHPRILVNELLGTRLAARLGLPTARVAVIRVSQELIDLTAELAIQLGTGRLPCRAGFQFGSRYPGDPSQSAVHDFLPDEQLREVENIADFVGMLIFDKWTCNTNGRQTIFVREPDQSKYRAIMIDQGFCFNAGEWNFPDAPLRGLYSRQCVYDSVHGMQPFETWLERIERISETDLDNISKEIPAEWYDGAQDELYRMLEHLLRRRKRVADLLLDAKKSYRQPFPNWT